MPQLESAPLDGPHLVTGILFALAAIIILELCIAQEANEETVLAKLHTIAQ